MGSRINAKTDREVDKLAPQDAAAAINYLSETLSCHRSRSQDPLIDDVIVSLANAHENRRARQVSEWESMRRQSSQPNSPFGRP